MSNELMTTLMQYEMPDLIKLFEALETQEIQPKTPRDMILLLADYHEKDPTRFNSVLEATIGTPGDATAKRIQEATSSGNYQQAQKEIERAQLRATVADIIKDIPFKTGGSDPEYAGIEIKMPKSTKKVPGVLPSEFERVVKLASLRINTALIGPAGCGKTFLAEKVAEALDLRFGSISCTAGMSENQLFGWLLPIGNEGRFVYVPAQFVDFYENGGVYLFDEFDNCDENTIGIINQAIANGQFCIPQRYENPVVKKHEDFVCIFALNTYGNGADMTYVGRTQLDGATVDRFRFGRVEMDYSRKVENKLVQPDLLEWARDIRKQIKSNKLEKILSTRYLIDATKWYETYKGDDEDSQQRCLNEIKEQFFMDWTPDEKRRVEAA